MDSESRQVDHESSPSLDVESEVGPVQHFNQPDAHCIFCRRAFMLETETREGFEAIFICRDCKLVVLDDLGTDTVARDSNRRRQQRRANSGSSESIEDLFSQQFTELIGLVRHNHETRQPGSHNSLNRSRFRRWQRPLSDAGSESVDHNDSLFGDNDSNISFSFNGGESDASVDITGLIERDVFIAQDEESRSSSDTDIDPMHAGINQWNSEDEDDVEWGEADVEEVEFHERELPDASSSPTGSSGRGGGTDGWLLWRTLVEPELPQYFGNSGDYLDARGFEVLLEQLAEADSSRRGAPPAAASFLRSLPCVTVPEKNGSLVCAVCKDPIAVGTEANRLPCLHFYHPSCILPWLRTRNSCPVCRFEFPTDDPDYEDGKRNARNRRELNTIHHQNVVTENPPAVVTDAEMEESVEPNQRGEVQGDAGNSQAEQDNPNRQRRTGWVYSAAVPIVSIVGFVLVMWLGSPRAEGSNRSTQEHNSERFQQYSGNNSVHEDRGHRNRRWWSFF